MSAEPLRKSRHLDDYEGLTGTFADACRQADRQHRLQQTRKPLDRPRLHLRESTRQAVEYLLQINDAERLNRFIAEHPRTEAGLIVVYVKGRRS
jgi:hypothetical protein